MEGTTARRTGNRLLDRLPAEDRETLVGQARMVELPQKHILWEPGDRVEFVYFPVTGVVSNLAVTGDGTSIEVTTVGNEGMVGIPVFLGQRHHPVVRAMSQIPGHGYPLDGDQFEAALAESRKLGEVLRQYTHAVLVHVAQGVVCNRLHSVEQRLARWVLEMDDRIRPKELPVTHEFLSETLGVRRATVTQAIAPLQSAGAITHERGRIRVVDQDALAGLACECYRVVRRGYDELLEPP